MRWFKATEQLPARINEPLLLYKFGAVIQGFYRGDFYTYDINKDDKKVVYDVEYWQYLEIPK